MPSRIPYQIPIQREVCINSRHTAQVINMKLTGELVFNSSFQRSFHLPKY